MIHTPMLGKSRAAAAALRRRDALIALSAAAVSSAAFALAPLTRRGKPQLTLGPFYPIDRSGEEDPDLTRVAGQSRRAQGRVIDIVGRITDEAGQPVPNASIDTWQTNAFGAYHHPSDESGQPQDPGFQGGAIFTADADGRYRMRTVMPQPYGRRQRHIHFDIRGRHRRLITQMFFPGEPNDQDSLSPALVDPSLQAAVTATLTTPAGEDGIALYTWDIVLAGE